MSVVRFILSKTFLKHLALAFLVIVILAFLVLQWLKISTHHGKTVAVPDLTKKTMEEVEELLDDADLRYEVLDSADYDPVYPKFSVIAQNPEAGDKVKVNRKIYVTLNPSGYRKVSVPNVIQVTRRNAESILRAVGFEIGEITYVDNIGRDMVLSISYEDREIEPGELLPKTSEIDLVCGNGFVPGEETEGENNEEEQPEGDGTTGG